ncbi:uncharacterized protein NPIL_256531 [Nephila pilipes]|uniref:Uncharacterized protein n=1 Tax=Nephila pilipes TaxID=299642 RepID=A0A8X6UIG3_NEPPI|nr:uncharacterized protein NPIL_256531 [Nephila pilipes]
MLSRQRLLDFLCPSTLAFQLSPYTASRWHHLLRIGILHGDARDYLTFWSQFRKILEDFSIANEDKFHYLLHAIVPKSKAARVLDSFPATADNYPKAVAQLQERFGREDLLVQIYVRDLLSMVMKNAATGRSKTDLPALYDELEAKIGALEVMGEEMVNLARTGFASLQNPRRKEFQNEKLKQSGESSTASAFVSLQKPGKTQRWEDVGNPAHHMLFFVTLFADMRSNEGMTSLSSHAPLRQEKQFGGVSLEKVFGSKIIFLLEQDWSINIPDVCLLRYERKICLIESSSPFSRNENNPF